jgi:hypothetical protein
MWAVLVPDTRGVTYHGSLNGKREAFRRNNCTIAGLNAPALTCSHQACYLIQIETLKVCCSSAYRVIALFRTRLEILLATRLRLPKNLRNHLIYNMKAYWYDNVEVCAAEISDMTGRPLMIFPGRPTPPPRLKSPRRPFLPCLPRGSIFLAPRDLHRRHPCKETLIQESG